MELTVKSAHCKSYWHVTGVVKVVKAGAKVAVVIVGCLPSIAACNPLVLAMDKEPSVIISSLPDKSTDSSTLLLLAALGLAKSYKMAAERGARACNCRTSTPFSNAIPAPPLFNRFACLVPPKGGDFAGVGADRTLSSG